MVLATGSNLLNGLVELLLLLRLLHFALNAILLLIKAIVPLTDLLQVDDGRDVATRAATSEIQRHLAQLVVILLILSRVQVADRICLSV